jgi:NADPH:quinone reductase-like Zn-dependent oxidoreductase
MRALELAAPGLEHLRLVERDPPRPRAHEVLLRLTAAAIGLRDYKMAMGAYDPAAGTLPLILGGEGVGEVVERGGAVTAVAIGDRVNPVFVQGWLGGKPSAAAMTETTLGGPLPGTFAEYIAVPEQALVLVPDHLSDAEAATLPFAGLTAWCAVHEQAGIRPGDLVIVQSTGGVALFALQFSKAAGAAVVMISKSDEKLAAAKALGADYGINYLNEPDWGRRVMDIGDGCGADLVVDQGGTATMAQSIRAVRPGGTICVVGAIGSAGIEVLLPYLLGRNIRVQGSMAGSRTSHEAMARAVGRLRLRPVVEAVAALSDGAEAVARMPKSEQFGKSCLLLRPS